MVTRDRHEFQRDDGVAATFVIVALTAFMFAAAAVAVDLSDFFEDARLQQNTADMACLAGVPELVDGDDDAAYDHATRNLVSNLPRAFSASDQGAGAAAIQGGGTWTSDDGSWEVLMTTPPGDTPRLRVTVAQASPTTFGQALGISNALVTRTATCSLLSQQIGSGDLPLGVLPGSFDGTIKADNCGQAGTGNCQYLDFPRDDIVGPHNPNTEAGWNIALGIMHETYVWDGVQVDCTLPPVPCNTVGTTTGNRPNALGIGLLNESDPRGRFRDKLDGRTFTYGNGPFTREANGDLFDDVITTDGTRTGPYSNVLPYASHITDCAHPRIARVPIVENVTGGGDWPPGASGPVRILGYYYVFIDEPNDGSHITGQQNVQVSEATAFAIDSETTCGMGSGVLVPFDEDLPVTWRLTAND